MKRILSLLLLLALPGIVDGRILPGWSYQEMFDQADLVVIAKVISTKDTAEKGQQTDIRPNTEVTAVATDIEARLILKGDKAASRFVLLHYRLARHDQPVLNGPNFVAFDPAGHQSYLLFLKKEADGRYSPVTGQNDPALFSVQKLEGLAR